MATKEYRELEQHIIDQFEEGSTFERERTEYRITSSDNVGKPRPSTSGGECKTDVYISAEDESGNIEEFKISVKRRDSNEFQENKVSAEKAEAYFGISWPEVLTAAIESIRDRFLECELICPEGKYPVKPNSIVLGWKLEITNKERNLSVSPQLTDQEIRDYVYKGTNQPTEKRDAVLNGRVIKNSGIASYLLRTEKEDITSPDDVMEQIVSIDDIDLGETYLVFTANNYRTDACKADGARPLAVSIKWEARNGKLHPCFIFDEPLRHTGEKDMANYLIEALHEIGFEVPCDLPLDFAERYLDW